MIYTRTLMEQLAKEAGMNLTTFAVDLGFDPSYIGNLLRTRKASLRLIYVLQDRYKEHATVQQFLAQDTHFNTKQKETNNMSTPTTPIATPVKQFFNFNTFASLVCGCDEAKFTVELFHNGEVNVDTVMQRMTFSIVGAEEFNAIQEMCEELVRVYEDWGHDVRTRISVLSFTLMDIENNNYAVREHYNSTFKLLDEAKTAGEFYNGDTGSYIIRYMDVDEREQELLVASWQNAFPKRSQHHTVSGNTLDIQLY